MTTTTKKTVSDAADGLSDMIKDAGDRIGNLGDRIIDVKDQSVREITRRTDTLASFIKDRPLLAVGMGLGAGYLLGRLLR